MKPGASNPLSAHVDASWASSSELNRHSRAGKLIYYCDAPIYVTSLAQKSYLSATVSELVALLEACMKQTWLTQLCQELQVAQKTTMISKDHAVNISLAESGIAKYFANTQIHRCESSFMSEIAGNQKIVFVQLPTTEMKVDFLTKPLRPGPFKDVINNLNTMK